MRFFNDERRLCEKHIAERENKKDCESFPEIRILIFKHPPNKGMHMKRKKRPITLLEIMVVILLIALIGSVVGYNMKGSMEKGKIFKTKQAVERIKEILYLEYNGGTTRNIKNINSEWKEVIKESGLAKNEDALFQDAWGNSFTVTADDKGNITVVSPKT